MGYQIDDDIGFQLTSVCEMRELRSAKALNEDGRYVLAHFDDEGPKVK